MKFHRHLPVFAASVVALVIGLAAAVAAEEKVEKRVIVRTAGGGNEQPAKNEPVTFLGVEAVNAPPALAAQLKLPEGYGLVVNFVVPDSPAAAAGIQKHDVLVKLDDQILVDQRQLSVLVRSKKEGDKVSLTYIRAGSEARASVALVKKELPRDQMRWFGTGEGMPFFDHGLTGAMPGFGEHVIELRDNAIRHMPMTAPAAGGRRVMIYRPKTNVVFADDDGVLELQMDDGTRTLMAKDPKGNVIFNGPVGTPEQRQALSEDLRQRLKKLEEIEVEEPAPPAAPGVPAVPAFPANPVPAVAPAPAPLTGASHEAPIVRNVCFRRALRMLVS